MSHLSIALTAQEKFYNELYFFKDNVLQIFHKTSDMQPSVSCLTLAWEQSLSQVQITLNPDLDPETPFVTSQ